jgi:hypothetical protein
MKGIKRHVAAKKMEDGTAELLVRKRWTLRFMEKIVSSLCRRRARNIYLPVFSDIGMEFDGEVGEHCSCSFFPHHMGR